MGNRIVLTLKELVFIYWASKVNGLDGFNIHSYSALQGAKSVKKILIRVTLAALLLLAAYSTPVLADGGTGPFCCPGCNWA